MSLSAIQRKAAALVAEDTLNYERIAEECGVNVSSVYNWKKREDFMALVREHVQRLDEAVSQLRFAKRRERVRALNDQAQDYLQIVEERSRYYADEENGLQHVPGGKTGRIIRQVKIIGTGSNAQRIEEFVFDKALDSQFQSTLEHIAKERGEWSEKRELSGPNGTPLLPIIEIRVTEPKKAVDNDD